ncbi:MAG TPA: TIGR03915 family putative DNA repair protein, partial [Oxalicibacterium sp.]|nr:TIGR03915 family putative DNA repair protein [Oxalicibacterium sp.]
MQSFLACADSFTRWRDEARRLLAQRIPPWQIQWSAHGHDHGLFDVHALTTVNESGVSLRVPRSLLQTLETAACFRADDRWPFLYKILWRWQNGDRTVLSVADEDGKRLHAMVKTVEREVHHMHAYLRFRERAPELGAPRFVAWFEPEHDVLNDVAVHFARRMGNTSWLIATPQVTIAWDGYTLMQGPPSASGPLQADDEGEQLWLAYYRSIFNPARVNARAMEMQMPVRYWKNMPESKLIPGLISEAAAGGRCVGQVAAVGARRGSNVHVD